jgi:predicted ATPase
MKLDTFSVKHYKSLSDVTVKFDENVTVIVGANSVGKSNFVDAMRFLRDVEQDGPGPAFSSRGGERRVLGLDVDVEDSLRFEIVFKDFSADSQYSFKLVTGQSGTFQVLRNPPLTTAGMATLVEFGSQSSTTTKPKHLYRRWQKGDE